MITTSKLPIFEVIIIYVAISNTPKNCVTIGKLFKLVLQARIDPFLSPVREKRNEGIVAESAIQYGNQ